LFEQEDLKIIVNSKIVFLCYVSVVIALLGCFGCGKKEGQEVISTETVKNIVIENEYTANVKNKVKLEDDTNAIELSISSEEAYRRINDIIAPLRYERSRPDIWVFGCPEIYLDLNVPRSENGYVSYYANIRDDETWLGLFGDVIIPHYQSDDKPESPFKKVVFTDGKCYWEFDIPKTYALAEETRKKKTSHNAWTIGFSLRLDEGAITGYRLVAEAEKPQVFLVTETGTCRYIQISKDMQDNIRTAVRLYDLQAATRGTHKYLRRGKGRPIFEQEK